MRIRIFLLNMCLIIMMTPLMDARYARSTSLKNIDKALIVGIEKYPDSSFDLPGVKDDIKLLIKALKNRGLVQQDKMRVLTDREATKKGILDAFREWLVDSSKPGDTVLFYYSGHGIQVWDENGDETKDGMDEALIPWDGILSANRLSKTYKSVTGMAFQLGQTKNLILDDEINKLLNRLKGRTVIFISDSCHSGSITKSLDLRLVKNKTIMDKVLYKSVFNPRKSSLGKESHQIEKNNIGADLSVDGVKLFALTASQDSQPAHVANISKEPAGLHSVFTWHLFHALNGEADLDKNGEMTLIELSTYLKTEIKRNGFYQVPQSEFKPEELGAFSLGLLAEALPVFNKRPISLKCYCEPSGGTDKAQLNNLVKKMKKANPFLEFTDNREDAQSIISVEKREEQYGARLSDATGAYWETHVGSDIEKIATDLSGNIKAYFIQLTLDSLKKQSHKRLDIMLKKNSDGSLSENAVVKGDNIGFSIKVSQPGYLYVMAVDCMGVLHPLYPLPDGDHDKIKQGETITIGNDGSFIVSEPYGKDMVFAFLISTDNIELRQLWRKDAIGDSHNIGFDEQKAFLDKIWNALAPEEKSEVDWISSTLLVETFER